MRRGTEERTGASMAAAAHEADKKYKGVRRRKWGKWVSEIRVPGSQERLWLGSYATPEAAAVAHDVAFYCLRRPISLDGLNFPLMLPGSLHANMSPRSVQKAASDAGMGVDAQMIANKPCNNQVEMDVSSVIQCLESQFWEDESSCTSGGYGINWQEKELSISVEDYLK